MFGLKKWVNEELEQMSLKVEHLEKKINYMGKELDSIIDITEDEKRQDEEDRELYRRHIDTVETYLRATNKMISSLMGIINGTYRKEDG